MGSGAIFADGLALQAGAVLALAVALVAALAGALVRARAHSRALASENEALRDEVWRLKDVGAAREQAEAASEAKSRYLATLGHEIRTPISGVLGMTGLLRQAPLAAEQAAYVEAIDNAGRALLDLVDQILDASRLESGRIGLTIEPVEVSAMIESVVELLAPRAQSKGLEIASSIAADAPRRVQADAMRLRQVLTNLAGNAVKFTSSGGVCVSVERVGARLLFLVTDTGPGVPPERRKAIFESFEQGDGSCARVGEGAGLGLPISRELVRLMGGDLVLADNPGGGSVFSFDLPLSLADDAPAAEDEASPRRPVALTGVRALIIANSPFEAPAIAARLEEAGARVERAEGLESGLAALARPAPTDLVIVDCALGAEATARLAKAARAAGASKSLVLFSPFERRTFGQSALKGFDGWLVKPVRARSLHERLAFEFGDGPPATPRSEAPAASPKQALLAEDDEIHALITRKALRRLGYEPVCASDGEEALRLLEAQAQDRRVFDLIVLDARMPGLDGAEVTRRLRGLERERGWPRARVVAVSAGTGESERLACLAAGGDAFLAKPFELDDLAQAADARRTLPPPALDRAC